MASARDVYLIDTNFETSRLDFFSKVIFFDLQTHEVCFLKGAFYFFVVVVDESIEDIFHLRESESTHKS